ncbi:MAG: helix-turn-helix domain-containing protein [Peptococcaceae bacterium]
MPITSLMNKVEKQKALLNASELLNSTQDINYILNSLIKQCLHYINGADAGIIFLYNEETQLLEVRSSVGFAKECDHVKLKPNESMTSITFYQKRPMIFRNPVQIKHAIATMSGENQELISYTYHTLFPQINSCICCPLVFGEKCIGVIVIDNLSNNNPLSDDDLDFLKSISVYAALALNNAINYEKEILNNINLQNYNKIIEKQRNEYQFSTQLHNKLTAMVLEGRSIQDIIVELANILNKDLVIFDLLYNIKNYTLERGTPLAVIKKNRGQISQAMKKLTKSEFRFPAAEDFLFLYPIIVSKENLGWLGIISKDPLDSELDNITVERGLTVLALELLKINEIEEMELKLKGDFLDNLINNYDREYLLKCTQRYGLNTEKEHQIIILEIGNGAIHKSYKFINIQKILYDFLSKYILNFFPNTISMIRANYIIFILELNKITRENLSRETISRIMFNRQIIASTDYSKLNIAAGISNPFADIFAFSHAFQNSLQALKIGRKIYTHNYIVFYEELEIKKLLLNNDPLVLENFAENILGPLLTYPNNSQKEFLETLSLYIKSNGNWSYTRDKLLIHGNTLSYRLKRIEEILAIDLNDYAQRLKIQIALEILEMLPL